MKKVITLFVILLWTSCLFAQQPTMMNFVPEFLIVLNEFSPEERKEISEKRIQYISICQNNLCTKYEFYEDGRPKELLEYYRKGTTDTSVTSFQYNNQNQIISRRLSTEENDYFIDSLQYDSLGRLIYYKHEEYIYYRTFFKKHKIEILSEYGLDFSDSDHVILKSIDDNWISYCHIDNSNSCFKVDNNNYILFIEQDTINDSLIHYNYIKYFKEDSITKLVYQIQFENSRVIKEIEYPDGFSSYLYELEYTYDNSGKLLRKTKYSNGYLWSTSFYTYDHNDLKGQVIETSGDTARVKTYRYHFRPHN